MSPTTLLLIAFIAWMLFMHLRPGGHGGCCGGGHGAAPKDGESDGAS
jgi:hypothetical protein